MNCKSHAKDPDALSDESTKKCVQTSSAITQFLMHRYGPLLDTKALVEVLQFPSRAAFERSMQRGRLVLRTCELPHRRGTFVLAVDVADFLARAHQSMHKSDDLAAGAKSSRKEHAQ